MIAVLLSAAAVQASPPPACGSPPPPGWAGEAIVHAGATAADAPVLAMGRGARVLLREGRVTPAPARPSPRAGILALDAPAAGRYRVSLGRGAWVDVVRGARTLASAAHGHGPACSAVRKMVDFDLARGRHLLVLSDADPAPVPVLVAPAR